MKKWEQQKSKLQHEKKIQSAKSTLSSTNPNKTSTSFTSPNGKSQLASHYSNISQSPVRSTQTDLSRVSHNSQISDYYEFEKQDLTSIPLYRLLKHYSLQQYAKALISRGYGYDLSKFATLARNDMDKLFSEINMIPGHKVKLMKLASQVTQICMEIMEQDDLRQFKQNLYTRGTSADIRKPKTANAPVNRSNSNPIKKKPATSAAEKKPGLTITKNASTTSAKKPMSSSQKTKPAAGNNNKAAAKTTKKLERIGFDFFSDSQQSLDDEFSKVLDSILDRYQDQMGQNAHFDGQPIFTQSRKAKNSHELLMRVNYSEADHMKEKLQGVISDIDSKDSSQQNESALIKDIDETSHHENGSDTRYYTNSPHDDTTQNYKDDSKFKSNRELSLSQVVQEKKAKEENLAGVEARARILELIGKKVDQGHLNKDELNLEFKKIKDMYSSFDGAKMTSTIANLDIEEISYCLACAIEKHVEYFVESIYPNGDFSMPVQKIEPKKEFNIQQLRYNFEQNLAKDDPNTLSISSGGRVMPKARDDMDLLTLQQQDNQRFKLQGTEPDQEDNIVEEVEEDVMEPEDKLGNNNNNNNLEGVEVVHKEEDDEVMHSESMGIGIIDDDEEEKLQDEEIDEEDGGVHFRQMEDINENMYKTNTPLDPYVTSQLEIISEKSYEASHNTVKLQQAFEEARKTVGPHDEIKQEIEENDREIEDFLRESLRDSILFNLKQEKQQDKVVQDPQESSASASGVDNHSLQGFTMQIQPTDAGEYMTSAMDLRSQVMNGGQGVPQMKQSDLMSSQFNGTTSEVLYQREKDWRELSMEESLYSELQWDNQNMDIADRIKMVFERTYNEKNITPDEYNKRIKHTVDKNSVQNYCKNIVITTKMEKEVVIICLIYIERLIVRTNMYLSALNWKRITFAALILASKIWDDESFENNNFARAFPQYTTKEINELEKVFLEFLDYNLMINGNDYAKYYFILRTFAEKNKKSFPLKALNLQTVRLLQKKAANTSKSLKEIYADPLNKTFS